MAHLSAVERARVKARIQGLGNYNPPELDEDDAAERALAQAGTIVSESLGGLSDTMESEGVVEATLEAVGSVGEAWARGLGAAVDWLQGEEDERTGQAAKSLGIAPPGAAYGVTMTSAGGGINAVWVIPEDAEPKEPAGKFSEAQLMVNRIAQCSVEATPAITDAILKECAQAGFTGPQLGEMICMAVTATGKESSSMSILTLLGHLQAKGGDYVRDALVEVKAHASAELLKLQSSQQYAERAEPLLKSTGVIEPPKEVDLLDFDDTPRSSIVTAPRTELADLLGVFDSTPKAAEPAPATVAPSASVALSTAPAVPTAAPDDFLGLLGFPAPAPAPATPKPASGGTDLFDLVFSTVPTPAKPAQRRKDELATAFSAQAALEPNKLLFDAFDKAGSPPQCRNQREKDELATVFAAPAPLERNKLNFQDLLNF